LPGEAIACNRAIDDLRIARRHGLVADAKPIHHAGANVLHHSIGMLGHPQEDLACTRLLEVEHHRTLVAIPVDNPNGHSAPRRPGNIPHDIALGRLDLDHVGAEVAEHHRTKRTTDHHAEVENPNTIKWAHAYPLERID
jgi:hypothetical protein